MSVAPELAVPVPVCSAPPGSSAPAGWPVVWGAHVDTRVVHRGLPDAQVTEQHVAGYLAKYATKATEVVGLTAGRLTPATIDAYADERTHTGRLIAACWHLGRPTPRPSSVKPALTPEPAPAPVPDRGHPGGRCAPPRPVQPATALGPHARLRRALLHQVPRLLHHPQRPPSRPPDPCPPEAAATGPAALDPTAHRDDSDATGQATTLVIGHWRYVGSGWLTTGDAALAAQAADAARSRRVHADPHHRAA